MPAPPLSTRTSARSVLRTNRDALRVFICDDDLDFASEMAAFLTPSGYEVRTLRDGKTPVEIFELFKPDVVMVDIFMPPPDGFEIVNHISQDTRRRSVAIVLASGADANLLDVASHFCLARGIKPAAVMRKPVQLRRFLEICEQQKEIAKRPPAGTGDPEHAG